MSNTQIWVFGILGFIVLISAVWRMTGKKAPWAVTMNEDRKARKANEALIVSTAEIQQDVAEIKDRLTSIERTLREVE